MPWHVKDHFSIEALAQRWHITPRDIQYIAERGMLEVQTWLSEVLFTRFRYSKVDNGKMVPIPLDILCVTGYVIVNHEELRKVFRSPDPTYVRRFISVDHKDLYGFKYNVLGTLLSTDTLEISHAEVERFEREHKLADQNFADTKTKIQPTSAGRPSVMKRITDQFNQRVERGQTAPTLAAEARCLRKWAESEWEDIPPPAIKTIANNLRQHFQAHKQIGG